MSIETVSVRRPAIYTRVSSEDQVSGTSLDDQVDKCLKQAAVYGWTVAETNIFVDDGYSGSNMDRPAITRLRAAIAAGDVDCVMVFKLDRLSRNIRDTVNLVLEEWSQQYKVVFRSVTEDFNTNSPLGTLIFSILASFAHFERDVIRDRTENGRRRRFAQGRRAVGEPPFGYAMGEVNGTMTIQLEQADVVRRIFHLYLQGFGFMKVAGLLNAYGYRTTAGHLFSDKTVRDILVNEVYTGKVKYGGKYNPGTHTPIIDAETFASAQVVRGTRERVGGRSLGSHFLLSGLVRCKGCAHLLYTQPATESHRKRKDGSIYITQNQAYYQCGGRLKKGPSFCTCGHIQQEVLESQVVARIRERFGGQVATEASIQALQDEIETQRVEMQEAIDRLDQAIQEKRQAIARWESAFESGELNAERFGARVTLLEAAMVDLQVQQGALQAEAAALTAKQVNVDWVHQVAGQVDTWSILPLDVRKQLLHYLIDQIRVFKPAQGRGKWAADTVLEVDIVWNRSERHLPEGDLALESMAK
jgi:site-specific DNA recombinase